jgi:hypothetical protein
MKKSARRKNLSLSHFVSGRFRKSAIVDCLTPRGQVRKPMAANLI